LNLVNLQVLTAVSVKMTAIWDTALHSVVQVIMAMMEVVSNSETSISLYDTARHNIPEHYHLQTGFDH
jgi:hypothetical protein